MKATESLYLSNQPSPFDISNVTLTMIKPSMWQLRIATVNSTKTHDKVNSKLTLGTTSFTHPMLVANIKEVPQHFLVLKAYWDQWDI